MDQTSLTSIIRDQTERALWEVGNVIDCIPDEYWEKCYCEMPMWKHVYHMLHSLDLWFINPRDKSFEEPEFHVKDLNNLDVFSSQYLERAVLKKYFERTAQKIRDYLVHLEDDELLTCPTGCEYTRFTLILAQHRHLHSHMGMIMGFIIDDTGLWPRVVGLEKPIPNGNYEKYL